MFLKLKQMVKSIFPAHIIYIVLDLNACIHVYIVVLVFIIIFFISFILTCFCEFKCQLCLNIVCGSCIVLELDDSKSFNISIF